MAENEASNGIEELIGKDNKMNDLSENADDVSISVAYLKLATNGENEVEMIVENSDCIYHKNGVRDANDVPLNNTQLNGFVANEEDSTTNNCPSEKPLQSETEPKDGGRDSAAKDCVTEKKSKINENRDKSSEENSNLKRIESEHLQFESYNNICSQIQAENKVDDDFHLNAGKFSFVFDDEEVIGIEY